MGYSIRYFFGRNIVISKCLRFLAHEVDGDNGPCSQMEGLQYLLALGQTKNMCVSDFPTDSPFSRRPTQVFLLCDSKIFIGDYMAKNMKLLFI